LEKLRKTLPWPDVARIVGAMALQQSRSFFVSAEPQMQTEKLRRGLLAPASNATKYVLEHPILYVGFPP
jgi:hypothetical protein